MRRCGARRCSQRKSPCQVPSSNRPPLTGITSELLVSAMRICAGMSSGPSAVWRWWGSFSGAMRSRNDSMSARAVGSAFSKSNRLALVCRTSTDAVPSERPDCFTREAISPVMSIIPWPRVETTNSVTDAIMACSPFLGCCAFFVAEPCANRTWAGTFVNGSGDGLPGCWVWLKKIPLKAWQNGRMRVQKVQ